ncbi:MAG: hypothetical protein HY828_13385 [Actinobacteria bacterium]|nr:hypothetical protein [Actinomycetota bacterium]
MTLSRERPTNRSGGPARLVIALAAVTVLAAAGCSSTAERSDATLPPLAGGPTTLALPGIATSTTSVAPDPGSSVPPSASIDPASTISSTIASGATVTWGGWAYYEVPQLGAEPVRGSGCGATGGLGDVVPDGIWNVNIGDGSGADRFWSGGTISLDLRCIYAGDAGRAQWNTVCSAAPDADACLSQSPDWFVVNVNSRLRTMPVAATVQYGVGALGTPPCAGVSLDPTSVSAPWRFMDSWVVVSGGQVTAVIAACPAG